jgi:DNA polymerase epsilon subunit 1
LYFLGADRDTFKTTIMYRPFFYLLTKRDDNTLGTLLLQKFAGIMVDCQHVHKIDLDQPNHLSPNSNTRKVWKCIFDNVSQLMEVRKDLQTLITQQQHEGAKDTNDSFGLLLDQDSTATANNPWPNLLELREYDVPYTVRACMDLQIRAGSWFTVTVDAEGNSSLSDADIETKADPTFLAFDIECTKAPLKFPSAEAGDEIYMISYMVSTPTGPQGYLICSRTVVSEDVKDFEYTPKPNYPGPFHIFNEKDEAALLHRFVSEYQRLRPQIVSTYNGDSFDWPYLITRAETHGVDLWQELGVTADMSGEVRGRCCVHLDAFCWVQRDSYLPQGSQGLKAVTKYKLGYDPVEVDPEDMMPMAQERPVHMATYSVSDAVATYYLYEKYVHLFIFSLCTLIPMGPEDVLRKGSGTLCEALLMVQACELGIICPNKQIDPMAQFHKGHLLESETYIGGKVECLETGVYRSDIEYEFDLKPTAFQHLIDKIDRDLCFSIEVEAGLDRRDIANYEEIRSKIVEQLELLRDRPQRVEKPYIYHLDVAAMYPNIILTNRLQPTAIVDDATCAACDFNQAKNGCKRNMDWVWRGDYSPAGKLEYDRTKDQLSREIVEDGKYFKDLPEREQEEMIAARLKQYSRNAYRKTKITEEVTRKDIVCMRENDFYVDTVRRFRDRRYDYKKMTKVWKNKIGSSKDAASRKQAEDKTLVYDSLQVAHKCILNSFYGYVMRKGARWRSMEMAGIVTKNGADLITQARLLVEQIGRPLELDTDGIWCILPKSFPDVYTFKTHDGSKVKLEYPCVMLNADVHDKFTNHQYQTLTDPKRGIYETRSECSIFFEVDGPYRAMILPSSTEEGKLLKKRYAVFNFDGSLAELKGFELKRRGELELIKTFQSQVFERFLDGDSLVECYGSVAEVANHWIDVIDTRGESLDDDELVDLISENRNMSRQLDDYGDQKGTSQTTARRLGEFLGAEIIKDKGLNCKFIIAEQPYGAPVTERAIPTAIWKAEPAVMKHYLRKWLKAHGLEGDGFDLRNILDWDYYLCRLGKTIQKIITIPAALQKVPNPCPRVAHPDWLQSKVRQINDKFQQKSIKSMFGAKPPAAPKPPKPVMMDIEDMGGGGGNGGSKRPLVHSVRRRAITAAPEPEKEKQEKRVELKDENFDSWLKQKKSLWRNKRHEQKRLLLRGDADAPPAIGDKRQRKTLASMEGFVRDAALNLTQREWQILEVREMTSYDSGNNKTKASSGEFVVWVMVGGDSLQKIQITVPRTVYVASRKEITNDSPDILEFKKVDKHLPHSKRAAFLYEVTMPEYVFRNKNWTAGLKPVRPVQEGEAILEGIYETGTPLMVRALTHLGCVSKLTPSASGKAKGKKSHLLSELKRVDRPTEGLYLNSSLSYKRCFLYVRLHPRTKTGLVALFTMQGGSGSLGKKDGSDGESSDLTQPSQSGARGFDLSTSCQLWIVKPGSARGQKNVSLKQCEGLFSQLLETIKDSADLESEYACVSPDSLCNISGLNFVDREDIAYAAANDAINSLSKASNGPTVLILNSSKPAAQLRRHVSTLNSFPVIPVPFPPGPDHNPSMSTLPALNWEQPAVQLCLEAYLFMGVVSFPKRVSYARYGNLPVGNLNDDENFTLFDVGLSRMLQKNRALSWASSAHGRPDLGAAFLHSEDGTATPSSDTAGAQLVSQDDIWGDDDALISPVIRRPGCYRSLCVDIDLQDLAIAALTDAVGIAPTNSASFEIGDSNNPNSPQSVANFDGSTGLTALMKTSEPLGDEMSTTTSLPMIRALVGAWLRDAFQLNSQVADTMLHHVYRLISNPDTFMHDPALHRVVHSLMKTTFMRLLSELQRLGCSIVYATFHRITVATNKTSLADAEEYIKFVISTVRTQSGDRGEEFSALSRIALRPRQFHTHYLFLDEYNFGTMHLERHDAAEVEDEFAIEDEEHPGAVVVPSVVTAWSIINYLGSEIAQEYFRLIIGRFSKDVLKKQTEYKVRDQENNVQSVFSNELNEQLLNYKKKMVSKHFATYLTRAVGEIIKDEPEDQVLPPMIDPHSKPLNPVLEFIKSVMVVLELDSEIDAELHVLKRSLLAQVGVAEYSSLAKWENPCPTFILPDVFCAECHESRDINLCYIPPPDEEESAKQIHWFCEDCGTEYDVDGIERRLIQQVHSKVMRYQLQDIRCSKTNRVATHALARVSECSAEFKLDIPKKEAQSELQTLHHLAEYHELEELKETTQGILRGFR